MDKIALAVEKRDQVGKCPNRRLRATGKIPAIMYGGKNQLMLSVDRQEFERKFKRISESVIIDLAIKGGDSHEVLIRDFQRDRVRGTLIHLDFYEVLKGHKLRTKVPIVLEGVPVGIRVDKGLLETQLYQMEVECQPKDLPANILVDITGLALNHTLYVRDVSLPAGVVSLESPETVIALVLSTNRGDDVSEEAEAVADAAPLAADQKVEPRAQEKKK